MTVRKSHNRTCAIRRAACALSAAVLVVSAQPAHAQWSGTFEPPTFVGNTGGIALNGQGEFFDPVPGASVSAEVYQYVGNTLGIPQNSTGETQFAASEGPGSSIFSRSELAIPFDDGSGLWMVSFDIAVTFTGNLPTEQNIGSLSTREVAVDATVISLATWVDPNTAANWNADYVWFDSTGTQLQEQVPNPAFQNLQVNHWYRWTTIFDLDTNSILEASITDLDSGTTVRQPIQSRYLFGGVAGAPPPSGFRLFAGSSPTPGNTVAWDNIMIARPGALVFQDAYAWGPPTMQQVLTDLAVPYDMASSADMATVDLDRYRMVVISSNQEGPFYTSWNANLARFENYVVAGGRLWLSTCAQTGTVPEPLVPGGVINETDLDDWSTFLCARRPFHETLVPQREPKRRWHSGCSEVGFELAVDTTTGTGSVWGTGCSLRICRLRYGV